VRIENVTLKTALTAICESIGCGVEIPEDPKGPLRISAAPSDRRRSLPAERSIESRSLAPISLSLREASLTDVLSTFGTILGAKTDLETGIEGSVTVEMQNVPANEVLDQLCLQHGLSWRISDPTSEGGGARLEIRKRAD